MSTNLITADQLNSLASAIKGKLNVLDTLPATVNGGLWLEGGGSVPIIKMYYGGNAFKITPELVIKATPTLVVGGIVTNALSLDMRDATSMYIQDITYTGDGNLYLFDFTGDIQAIINGKNIEIGSGNGTFKVGATEGTNYAAATPVTVTVTGNGSSTIPTITTDNENVTLEVLTEDTETTAAIRERCIEGLNEGNILTYWADNIQDELSGLVDTGSDMFDIVTVQMEWSNAATFPVTITYNAGAMRFDDGWNYYVIFTTDTAVEDYILCEAVGQSDSSVTFDLIQALDVPMTMIVLQAQE